MQTISITLMVLGGLLSLLNWLMLYESYRTKRFHSAVPLIGALLLGGGMFLLSKSRPYALLAVLIDYGTLALMVALPHILKDTWSTSKYNLLVEYVGRRDALTVHLRLYRRNTFVVRWHIQRPPNQCGLVETGRCGTWRWEGESLMLEADSGETAFFEAKNYEGAELLQQRKGFQSSESNSELSLAGVTLGQKH